MDYREGKYEEIKEIDKQKSGWRNLGDYGWGFSVKNAELIKEITKEDGWRVFKLLDPNENVTDGYPRAYYFISDKRKVFVPVSQQAWDNESFQNYMERAIGKQKKFLVTAVGHDGATKYKKTEIIWAADEEGAKEKFEAIKSSRPHLYDPKKDYKIVSVKEQF